MWISRQALKQPILDSYFSVFLFLLHHLHLPIIEAMRLFSAAASSYARSFEFFSLSNLVQKRSIPKANTEKMCALIGKCVLFSGVSFFRSIGLAPQILHESVERQHSSERPAICRWIIPPGLHTKVNIFFATVLLCAVHALSMKFMAIWKAFIFHQTREVLLCPPHRPRAMSA